MSDPDTDARATARHTASLLVVVAANCYPLAGVLAFGWDLLTVLVLYWVEMGVAALWGVPRALLAVPFDRSVRTNTLPLAGLREKRGGWTYRGHTFYVRNVPTALLQLSMLGVVWVGIGLFFAATLDLWNALGDARWLTVAAGALAITVAHGVSFAREYVGEREYEHTSPRMAISHTGQQTVFVLLLAVPVAASESFRTGGLVVVVGVVAAKLLAETYRRVSDDEPGDGVLAAVFGDRDTTVDAPTVPVPEGDPDAVRTPDSRAVRIECACRGLATLVSRPAFLCAIATVFLAVVLRSPLALLPASLLLAGVCLGAAGRYLQLGTMAYHRYGDALVGHDRLLEEPQWRAPLAACEGLIPRRLVDRVADTALVELDWREPNEGYWPDAAYDPERTRATVGPFADFAAAVLALDLPVRPADRPEPNRTVAYAALAFVAAFACVPALAWHVSRDPAVIVVAFLSLTVVGPFVVVAVYYL
ncbi:hypothetical protein J2752_001986 [Halarchaeum rubridurum]|uniref:Uncharacterized protein n=1 Tax=Halarchaeum rubridurum TaxID=489911 RepID=A0A830G0J7_9EURY|nr:DUF6498-containing protein [Halarchaeum rubridurum]MBP1955074.1 hypothetical protein [Halarchaeum rubridurum]GGM69190.1 hypothetical protein GCM10009017_19210 [Halarchaeum rubridurum]